MLIRISYFNIILAVVQLGVLMAPHIYPDMITAIGLVLTVWYNWTVVRRLMGQEIRWRKLAAAVGVVLLFFAFIILIDSIYKFTLSTGSELERGGYFLAFVDLIFGVSIIYQVMNTIRGFRTAEKVSS